MHISDSHLLSVWDLCVQRHHATNWLVSKSCGQSTRVTLADRLRIVLRIRFTLVRLISIQPAVGYEIEGLALVEVHNKQVTLLSMVAASGSIARQELLNYCQRLAVEMEGQLVDATAASAHTHSRSSSSNTHGYTMLLNHDHSD